MLLSEKFKIYIMKYILLFVLTLVFSCNSTKKTSEDIKNLGETFKVKEIVNSTIELKVKPTIHLDFEKNMVSGNAGCNNYSGTIIQKGNQLKFGNLVATKMYCGNMKIEKEFLHKMGTVRSFKIENSQFLLYNEANELVLSCETK